MDSRFPTQENFPDLRKKLIKFMNDPDFKPTVHTES